MVQNNKILTVSYGTFSCTLEGFDDSFDTMKAIANYFHDLAAEDRYFGAEPPQPDAEVLARIAQREIARRVDAHEDETGIVLRTEASRAAPAALPASIPAASVPPAAESMAQATPTPAPEHHDARDAKTIDPQRLDAVSGDTGSQQTEDDTLDDSVWPSTELVAELMPEPQPRSTVGQDSITVKLQRIRAVVSRNQERPGIGSFSEDQHADAMFPTYEDGLHDRLPDTFKLDMPATAEVGVATPPNEQIPDPQEEEAPAPAMETSRVEGFPDASADEGARGETTLSSDTHMHEDEAKSAQQDTPSEAQQEAEDGADLIFYGDTQDRTDESHFVTAEDTEDAVDPFPELLDPAALPFLSGRKERPDSSEDDAIEAGTVGVEVSEIAPGDPGSDRPEDDPEDSPSAAPEPADSADEAPSDDEIPAWRPRMMRVKRTDFAAAVAPEPTDGETRAEPNDLEGPYTDLGSNDPPSEDMQLSQGDERKVPDPAEEVGSDLDVDPEPTASASGDDVDSDGQDDPSQTRPFLLTQDYSEPPAEHPDDDPQKGMDRQDPPVEGNVGEIHATEEHSHADDDDEDARDEDTRRLLAVAQTILNEPEATASRETYSQLRAASTDQSSHPEPLAQPDEDTRYREDMASFVRPRRPVTSPRNSERPESTDRPAPLKLAADLRVDGPAIDPPKGPIQPRRIHASSQDETSSATDDEGSAGFVGFAHDMGATELPDLLEAAAAYLSFVEGRPQFSRPQLMKRVKQVDAKGFKREDGLRSFGHLLQAGKIEKAGSGRFTVSDDIGFRPDHRLN